MSKGSQTRPEREPGSYARRYELIEWSVPRATGNLKSASITVDEESEGWADLAADAMSRWAKENPF